MTSMLRSGLRFLALGLALALVLVACGGGGSDKSSGGGGGGGSLPKCPLDALKKATSPVQITMWEEMTRANEEALQRLTDKFNASQSKVKVTLVNQTGYKEAFQKFRAGLSGGDLPDIGQFEDTVQQQMIDSRAILPVQSCIDAEKYDMSDYIKRVTDYYSVRGVQYSMPFNVSNPVFFYDKNAFRAAELDPEKPPTSLDEVKADAQKIKAAGYETGFGLKLDPWYLEQWSAKGGKLYVNNGNGRKGRATAVEFDNSVGLEILTWMDDMVKSGLAKTNSADGPSAYDNLLGIRSKRNGMTIDTSATLGTIKQVLESGEGGGVQLGVAPMPGPVGKGGVLVGGATLYISNKSAPEKQAAAWEFAKFLTTAENQAQWSADTGYIPVRKSSADVAVLKDHWAKNPQFKVAYEQLLTGVNNLATAGPVIGDYQGVRDEVLDAELAMFSQGVSPKATLDRAKKAADSKIQEYNGRVE
jgi:sn-glycerol 3-phosphate transport system substrate-binding protein